MSSRGSTLRLSAACAVAIAASGCSLILDFDDPPGTVADAAAIDAIAQAACDLGEPNDGAATATPSAAGVAVEGGICNEGDEDFYLIDVGAGQTLTVDLLFTQDGPIGDLDFHVLLGDGTTTAGSALSLEDDEHLVCPSDEVPRCTVVEGPAYIRVTGYMDMRTNGYTLTWQTSGGTPPDAGP